MRQQVAALLGRHTDEPTWSCMVLARHLAAAGLLRPEPGTDTEVEWRCVTDDGRIDYRGAEGNVRNMTKALSLAAQPRTQRRSVGPWEDA